MQKNPNRRAQKDIDSCERYDETVVGTRKSETNYILGCKLAMNISFRRSSDCFTIEYTDREHNHEMNPDPLATDFYITAYIITRSHYNKDTS